MKKKLVFTFDDGMLSNYQFTVPVLKQFGFSATFFVTYKKDLWKNTALDEPQISWSQLNEMAMDGFEIGNHSYSHISVENKSCLQIKKTIKDMELVFLEHNLPKPITFSYPSYRCTSEAAKLLQSLGYRYSRAGYLPNEPNYENFQKDLACAPWKRNTVSYYFLGKTNPHMIFVTGIINGNVNNPCYNDELFIKDLENAKDGAIPVFAGHGMPTEIRQKAFIKIVEYCHQHNWQAIALKDI